MPVLVFYEYLTWQYGEGVREFVRAWFNIHWFLWRVFSVPLLLRTFFAPFRRTNEKYARGFNPQAIAQTFLINLVTRLVGAIAKSALLAVAFLFQGFLLVIGFAMFLLFLASPVAVPASVLVAIVIVLI